MASRFKARFIFVLLLNLLKPETIETDGQSQSKPEKEVEEEIEKGKEEIKDAKDKADETIKEAEDVVQDQVDDAQKKLAEFADTSLQDMMGHGKEEVAANFKKDFPSEIAKQFPDIPGLEDKVTKQLASGGDKLLEDFVKNPVDQIGKLVGNEIDKSFKLPTSLQGPALYGVAPRSVDDITKMVGPLGDVVSNVENLADELANDPLAVGKAMLENLGNGEIHKGQLSMRPPAALLDIGSRFLPKELQGVYQIGRSMTDRELGRTAQVYGEKELKALAGPAATSQFKKYGSSLFGDPAGTLQAGASKAAGAAGLDSKRDVANYGTQTGRNALQQGTRLNAPGMSGGRNLANQAGRTGQQIIRGQRQFDTAYKTVGKHVQQTQNIIQNGRNQMMKQYNQANKLVRGYMNTAYSIQNRGLAIAQYGKQIENVFTQPLTGNVGQKVKQIVDRTKVFTQAVGNIVNQVGSIVKEVQKTVDKTVTAVNNMAVKVGQLMSKFNDIMGKVTKVVDTVAKVTKIVTKVLKAVTAVISAVSSFAAFLGPLAGLATMAIDLFSMFMGGSSKPKGPSEHELVMQQFEIVFERFDQLNERLDEMENRIMQEISRIESVVLETEEELKSHLMYALALSSIRETIIEISAIGTMLKMREMLRNDTVLKEDLRTLCVQKNPHYLIIQLIEKIRRPVAVDGFSVLEAYIRLRGIGYLEADKFVTFVVQSLMKSLTITAECYGIAKIKPDEAVDRMKLLGWHVTDVIQYLYQVLYDGFEKYSYRFGKEVPSDSLTTIYEESPYSPFYTMPEEYFVDAAETDNDFAVKITTNFRPRSTDPKSKNIKKLEDRCSDFASKEMADVKFNMKIITEDKTEINNEKNNGSICLEFGVATCWDIVCGCLASDYGIATCHSQYKTWKKRAVCNTPFTLENCQLRLDPLDSKCPYIDDYSKDNYHKMWYSTDKGRLETEKLKNTHGKLCTDKDLAATASLVRLKHPSCGSRTDESGLESIIRNSVDDKWPLHISCAFICLGGIRPLDSDRDLCPTIGFECGSNTYWDIYQNKKDSESCYSYGDGCFGWWTSCARKNRIVEKVWERRREDRQNCFKTWYSTMNSVADVRLPNLDVGDIRYLSLRSVDERLEIMNDKDKNKYETMHGCLGVLMKKKGRLDENDWKSELDKKLDNGMTIEELRDILKSYAEKPTDSDATAMFTNKNVCTKRKKTKFSMHDIPGEPDLTKRADRDKKRITYVATEIDISGSFFNAEGSTVSVTQTVKSVMWPYELATLTNRTQKPRRGFMRTGDLLYNGRSQVEIVGTEDRYKTLYKNMRFERKAKMAYQLSFKTWLHAHCELYKHYGKGDTNATAEGGNTDCSMNDNDGKNLMLQMSFVHNATNYTANDKEKGATAFKMWKVLYKDDYAIERFDIIQTAEGKFRFVDKQCYHQEAYRMQLKIPVFQIRNARDKWDNPKFSKFDNVFDERAEKTLRASYQEVYNEIENMKEEEKKNSKLGLAIGIPIGIVAVLTVILIATVIIRTRRRSSTKSKRGSLRDIEDGLVNVSDNVDGLYEQYEDVNRKPIDEKGDIPETKDKAEDKAGDKAKDKVEGKAESKAEGKAKTKVGKKTSKSKSGARVQILAVKKVGNKAVEEEEDEEDEEKPRGLKGRLGRKRAKSLEGRAKGSGATIGQDLNPQRRGVIGRMAGRFTRTPSKEKTKGLTNAVNRPASVKGPASTSAGRTKKPSEFVGNVFPKKSKFIVDADLKLKLKGKAKK